MDNGTTLWFCHRYRMAMSDGVWFGHNPLNFNTPLLLLQISVITLTWQLLHLCLKRLGQSIIISQIVGGIMLGPSVLGRFGMVSDAIFPKSGNQILETLATFGIMISFFLIGVKADVIMMLRPNKRAMTIGFSVFFFTLTIPTAMAIVLVNNIDLDPGLSISVPLAAISQAITALPVVALLMMELKIINTELGRLALATTVFCDILGVSVILIVFSAFENKDGNLLNILWALASAFALVGFASYVFRPAVLWMANQTPPGKPIESSYVGLIMVGILLSGIVSEFIGQHYVFGPLVFGLAVPDGPPLGSTLVSKLDTVITEYLYPLFVGCSGLKTNLFSIHLKTFFVMTIVLGFQCIVKTGAVILPALYFNMSRTEAIVLGLTMNIKGITELVLYNLWIEVKLIGEQEFSMLVLTVMASALVVPPLTRLFYDPTDVYMTIERNTLQHSKRDSELRIMVCIHNQDTVPTIINLLEISNPRRESPILVIVMQLVELVGRSAPILMAHGEHATRTLEPNLSKSNHITNALKHYQLHHEECTTIKIFTTVTHFETMHDDIVQVSGEHRAALVIMPFHKQWAIDGTVGSTIRQIQNVNVNVLSKAPCSVGILVDRGILNGSLSIINTRSDFHVAVLFFGGEDDMESLAYGARMASHERCIFTLIRLILPESTESRSRKIESDYINEVRRENSANDKFAYFEEGVSDGVSFANAVKEMVTESHIDLILVGKHHPQSEIMLALEDWSECPELGVVGDMLTSLDFGCTASVLVVQQHRVAGSVASNNHRIPVEDQQGMPSTPPGGEQAVRNKEHIVAMCSASDTRQP